MGKDLNANDDVTVSPADPDGNNQPADGKSADKAVIRYAQYKTDPSVTVDLSLSGSNGRFEDGTKSKDKVRLLDGAVTVPFYSTASGPVTLTAYLTSNKNTYGYYDFHFAQAVKKVDLEVVPGYGSAPPDGSTPDKVKATVRGYDDKGIAYIPVTFRPDPQARLDPDRPVNTKSDGAATVSITNTVAGDVRMTATAGGVTSSPVTVHFGSSTLKVKAVDLKFVSQTAPADGKTPVRGVARVKMSDGNPAPDGTQISFAASNGATADPASAYMSGGLGQAMVQVTSTTVGASSVTATSGDVTSSPVALRFSGSALTVDTVKLGAIPKTAPADGKTTVMGVANVTMSDGSPAPDGTQVTFTPSNGATADPASAYTADGMATTQIASETVGASSVTARAGGKASDSVTVQFSAPPLTVKTVKLGAIPKAAPADGTTTVMGVADVTMSDGSPAPDGTQVTFMPSNGAKAFPTASSTSSGMATTQIASGTVGASNVTASAGGKTSDPVTVEFTAVPSTVKTIDLKVDPQTAPANGKAALTATATVAMSDGSPAPDGTQVTFAATNGATANPARALVSGGQGRATTRITSTTVGASSVTAASGDLASNPVTVQFSLPAKAVGLVIPPQTSLADGKTAVIGIATVLMSDDRPAPDGTQVTFAATNGATPDPVTVGTSSGGWANLSLTSKTMGTSSVTATAGGVTSDPVDVTFYPFGDQMMLVYNSGHEHFAMHIKEDGETIDLVNQAPWAAADKRGNMAGGSQTSPYIFTLVPYDGSIYRLASTAYGNLRYLVVGVLGKVSAVPASTDDSSLFRVTPVGVQSEWWSQVLIQSVSNGMYLYSYDLVSVAAGLSDVNDKRCQWLRENKR